MWRALLDRRASAACTSITGWLESSPRVSTTSGRSSSGCCCFARVSANAACIARSPSPYSSTTSGGTVGGIEAISFRSMATRVSYSGAGSRSKGAPVWGGRGAIGTGAVGCIDLYCSAVSDAIVTAWPLNMVNRRSSELGSTSTKPTTSAGCVAVNRRTKKPPLDAPTMTYGGFSPAVCSAARKSSTTRGGVSTVGRASLHPDPARSYEQTRVDFATSGCTSDQSIANELAPASSTTAGDPLPVQLTWSLRPPMSTRRPGAGPMSIACAATNAGAQNQTHRPTQRFTIYFATFNVTSTLTTSPVIRSAAAVNWRVCPSRRMRLLLALKLRITGKADADDPCGVATASSCTEIQSS